MSDTDNQLDTMLTETEDTATQVEALTEDDVVMDTDDTESKSTGRQPDQTDGDAQTDDQQTETDRKDTVPVGVLAEQRKRTRELRNHLRPMYDRIADLERENADLRRKPATQDQATSNQEDDDEPLTRAELRRIREEERQQADLSSQANREAQDREIARQVALAPHEDQQLLVMAEPYISQRDREAIAKAEDRLGFAIELAKQRVEAFGTDRELDLLDRLFPLQQQPQKKSASASRDKPNGKAGAKTPKPATTDSGTDLSESDDVDPHTRGLLDYMFNG